MQEQLPTGIAFSSNETTTIGGQTMPHDATNIPHSRSAPYRSSESVSSTGEKLDATLKLENMLLEEFNYAGLTAYQSMEDRTRMFNLYLLLVGVLASGLGVVFQLRGSISIYSLPLAIALLLIAGIAGIAFFTKLIRLRQAWRESVICMNVIKEFYIQQFKQQMPRVEHAFRWRLKSIPAGESFGSTTFVVCATVALLESVCFAGAAFVIADNVSILSTGAYPYISALLIFAIVLLLNVVYFWHALNVHSEQAVIEEEAEEIGI